MKKWPADKVERIALDAISFMPNNSRTHSDEQVEEIAASISEWGWTQPILIDSKNRIIAGEGRARAAKHLNIDEVPVMRAVGWSAQQVRAYVIAETASTIRTPCHSFLIISLSINRWPVV